MLAPSNAAVIFGENVLARSKQLGISQTALAERVGITPPSINHIVKGNGEPRLSTALAIAKALDTTIDELLQPAAQKTVPLAVAQRSA